MERPLKVHIHEDHWTAYIASIVLKKKEGVAITIFRTIYLNNCSRDRFMKSPEWVRHEIKHVWQYHEEGCFVFLIKYLWYSIRYGYELNPFEVDARKAEKNPEVMNGIQII